MAAVRKAVAPGREDCDLFEEMAGDIAFALHGVESERRRAKAEQSLRLNEMRLDALLRLGQMTDASLKEITDFCLEEVVRLTESKIGYLAFVNDDESVLTMYSWSKSAMQQCAIIDKPIVYPVVNTGLWGEAVRQRKPVITNDYAAANPWKKGFPAGHVSLTRHMNAPGVRRPSHGRRGRGWKQGIAVRRIRRTATDAADAGHVAADPAPRHAGGASQGSGRIGDPRGRTHRRVGRRKRKAHPHGRGARRRQAGRRERQPRQEHVPGQHEPRNSDAAERGHRNDGPGAPRRR